MSANPARPGTHGTAAIPVTAGIAAAAWAVIVTLYATGHHELASHQDVFESRSLPGALAAFLAAWLLMVAAMMLPTVLPVAASFDTGPMRFLVAYVTAWTGFGVAALVGDGAVHRVVDTWAWLDERQQLVAAGVLVAAGLYQLSPLKRRHLADLRHAGNGPRYTRSCLVCCGGLMLVMFAVGVGSLAWMGVLTAAMILEKVSPAGVRLSQVLGAALVGLAALAVLSPGIVT
jgi:predicted metal-binding membrane protein